MFAIRKPARMVPLSGNPSGHPSGTGIGTHVDERVAWAVNICMGLTLRGDLRIETTASRDAKLQSVKISKIAAAMCEWSAFSHQCRRHVFLRVITRTATAAIDMLYLLSSFWAATPDSHGASGPRHLFIHS